MQLTALLAALVFQWAAYQSGVAGFASVRGTVTTGYPAYRPLANVRVIASSDVDLRETRTDSQGRYWFLTLIPGTYRISVAQCTNDDAIEMSSGIEYQADINADQHCP
jgi:hypothetical protein